MINFTTGPVDIPEEVIEALNSPIISHRSETCIKLHQEVVAKLCDNLQVKQTFIMTGSGTLANDAMLYQIKSTGEKGLILTNGEFGDRLRKQAERLELNFSLLQFEWGTALNTEVVEKAIQAENAQWILLCHCETSTGRLADLPTLIAICKKYNTQIYLDCMSTFGTYPLSLEGVAMATASSAKAIGSLSGLALVFSNIEIIENTRVPIYLDLFHLKSCHGIPFTISFNLLAGLNTALDVQSKRQIWQQTKKFSASIYESLAPEDILPFAQPNSFVFTIVLKNQSAHLLGTQLLQHGIKTSFESSYLLQRNWLQIALFSSYEPSEIDILLREVRAFIAKVKN